MADDKLAELLKTQKSLTEWLEDIKHKDAEAIRREDNEKRERLKVLNRVIGLPFDEPTQFEALDLADNSAALQKYLKTHGSELCALRLIPKHEGLPKLRMRGKSVIGAYHWFLEQNIDASKYRADFIPHVEDSNWATIFVINKNGIQGEIIRGGHHQLTQGFHDQESPILFRYDFKHWMLYPEDKQALSHLKQIIKFLKVTDKAKVRALEHELKADFSNNYLNGYFETTDSSAYGTWFIDYSPMLGKLFKNMAVKAPGRKAAVSGMCASPGKAKGIVKIVNSLQAQESFPEGAILVCKVTTPDFVPLMQKAAAIVTDQGGILSHAAIVARELGKPCIVGTQTATKVLIDGQIIHVDADNCTVS